MSMTEASGVVRRGDSLLLVSDADAGTYYSVRLEEQSNEVIPIDPVQAKSHPLVGGVIAVDLEAIDVLADGRVVALSERIRGLVGESSLVAQYDDPFTEIGERGLEGLAVRHEADGSSTVAVLWEGGYPENDELPAQLRHRIGRVAFRPVVLVHSIAKDQTIRKAVGGKEATAVVELAVPQPNGAEPEAQRFRAPDLVWHRSAHPTAGSEWQFIVLLNSQNGADEPSYGPTLLQRFSMQGQPVGEACNLDAIAPEPLRGANWEGLAWFEPGRKLIAVHDAPPKLTDGRAAAWVFDVPREWR